MKYKINQINKWLQIEKIWFIRVLKIRYFRVFIALVLVTAFWVINFPVAANIILKSQVEKTQYIASLEKGKELYETGIFSESVNILQQVVTEYRNQGLKLQQAVALSNLALAYQKLGNLNQAQIAITESVKLIQNQKSKSQNTLAAILNIQGSIQLD